MISARTALPDFGRLGFGAVVGVIGLAGLGMGASAVAVAEESKAPVHPMLGAAVTLYQYDVCPFCNKVRAFLDLHKVPYTIVEVNPLFKNELKFSEYKKVPVVMVGDEQLNDSSNIMRTLLGRLEKPKRAGLFGSSKAIADAEAEESQWFDWVDSKLVHIVTPNIYRTTGEALQAFDYITERGNFNAFEREAARYTGAVAMYALSKLVLKKKYGIEDEREDLYAAVNDFVSAVGARKFLGGDKPNLADTATFGVLRAVQTMDTFQDVMANTGIKPWYERMAAVVSQ